MNARCQRVTDIRDRYAVLPEKRLFERKNPEQSVDDPAHRLYPAFTPRPDLRGDQVDHRNPEPLHFPGHRQMEIRRIGENGKFRPAPGGRTHEFPEPEPDTRQMRNHLHYPDYGQILRTDDRLDARLAQVRARASEEIARGPAPSQLADQFGGIVVAGSFSGRYQDGARRRGQPLE